MDELYERGYEEKGVNHKMIALNAMKRHTVPTPNNFENHLVLHTFKWHHHYPMMMSNSVYRWSPPECVLQI